MNILAVVLLATQASVWMVAPPEVTVGDTVRLTRRVDAEPDAHAAAMPLAPTAAFAPLSLPTTAYSEGGVVIMYRLTFFETGDQSVSMPDLELVHGDGTVSVVPGDTARVRVVSVLPAGDGLPPPRPSLGPISRVDRSLVPAISIVLVTSVCLVGWTLWRRRTAPRPAWTGSTGQAIDIPLQQWMMAGESKAVVGAISDRLRCAIAAALPAAGRQLSTGECLKVIAANRPDWPRRDLEEVLRSIDRALYAPAVPSDLALLVDQVDDLLAIIHEDSSPEEAGA